jgi:hypothetical protein
MLPVNLLSVLVPLVFVPLADPLGPVVRGLASVSWHQHFQWASNRYIAAQ